MNAALFATIWLALALFVAGEAGKRVPAREPGLLWRAWTLGGVLCAAHMALALGVRHGWSHAAARADIARQTAEIYGLAWGGGLYLNYVFVGAWLAEAGWWRADPAGHARRPRWITWTQRAFAGLMFVNGAVVFASPAGRVAGVPLLAALLWVWRPERRARSGAP